MIKPILLSVLSLVSLTVHHAFGQDPYHRNLQSSLQTQVDVSRHPGGVYFMRIQTDTGWFSTKLPII
ncbi:MAG: hypothetical protein AAF587_35670 [Bacteroidota bacterium]